MLKRLALVWLCIVALNVARPQVPRDGGEKNHKADNGTSKPAVSQPISEPATDAQDTSAAKKKHPDHEPYHYPWRELLAPANLPNWGLVVVGGLAAGLAYWTLRKIESQTKQLTVQTSLMREQTERMVERERA